MKLKELCQIVGLIFVIAFSASADAVVTNELTSAVEKSSVKLVFHGQELFEVYGISSVPAESRAKRAEKRIIKKAKSPLADTDDIAVFHDDEIGVSVVMCEGDPIIAIWDSDAETEGKLRITLADERCQLVRDVINQYRKDHTTASYLRGGLLAVGVTVLYLLLGFVVKVLKRKELNFVGEKFAGQKMLKFLDGDTVVSINATVMKLISSVIMLVAFIIYLNIVLSFFPWTFNLSAKLFDLISAPIISFGQSFVENLPNIFALLIILAITNFVLRGLKNIFDQIGEGKVRIRGFYQDWAETTFSLIRMVIVVFAAVVAFPFIPGSGSPAFKGISIFMGVLVSLGSSSAVGNIFGGLTLTYMRSFMSGDFVEINGMRGTVVSRRTFSTRLKTITNEIISIPNSAVASNPIINFSKMTKSVGVNVGTVITIGYDIPFQKVKDLLLKSVDGVPDVLTEPAPSILILGLDDFYVRYKLIISTKNPAGKFRILSNLHENILNNFAEANVEIMSPHYQANRSGEEITIPAVEGMTEV